MRPVPAAPPDQQLRECHQDPERHEGGTAPQQPLEPRGQGTLQGGHDGALDLPDQCGDAVGHPFRGGDGEGLRCQGSAQTQRPQQHREAGHGQGQPAAAGRGQDDGGEQQDSQASAGRRVSDFEEVRDGGYGVGSAAPLGDGAQPLGHEVKASREGGTFLTPGDEGYDDREPDVWFYDEDAARRSGFRRSGE